MAEPSTAWGREAVLARASDGVALLGKLDRGALSWDALEANARALAGAR